MFYKCNGPTQFTTLHRKRMAFDAHYSLAVRGILLFQCIQCNALTQCLDIHSTLLAFFCCYHPLLSSTFYSPFDFSQQKKLAYFVFLCDRGEWRKKSLFSIQSKLPINGQFFVMCSTVFPCQHCYKRTSRCNFK